MVNCEACGALLDAAWVSDVVAAHAGKTAKLPSRDLVRQGRGNVARKKNRLQRIIGLIMSTFVTVQVTVVFLGNVFVIFPALIHIESWYTCMVVMQCLSLGLYSALMVLYWSIILLHPGKIPKHIESICIGYQWCHVCEEVKPPQAHHCRRCGMCIMGLDHHCLYTGNTCIGRDTMSYFMYFLICLVIGSGISSMASMGYFWMHRDVLLSHYVEAWRYPYPSTYILRVPLFIKNWVWYTSEFEDIVWIDVLISSLAACLGGTSLLMRQLRCAARGTTYLQERYCAKEKDS